MLTVSRFTFLRMLLMLYMLSWFKRLKRPNRKS
jgi:hypothetical protein